MGKIYPKILKGKNIEIYVQKILTENSNIKEGFQSKIEMISTENEEIAKNYERSIAELKENIEKLKKVYFTNIKFLNLIKNYVGIDSKRDRNIKFENYS